MAVTFEKCPNCVAVEPVILAEMHADEKNDHDAVDLICADCRYVVATLHEK